MKSHLDFENYKDYEKYLIVYFSGQIMASFVHKYSGGCGKPVSVLSHDVIEISKELVEKLKPIYSK